ncbi:MAG: hypothetical protein C5B55_00710 [Blastocatellia bacterium]|nr:MAG: hypothetical protein C5B55_00710 [Blastocatellia bacterium]
MQAIDLSRPGEKKKLIWAGILGFVAVLFLWWTFFGFGSSSTPQRAATTPGTQSQQRANRQTGTDKQSAELEDLTSQLEEVNFQINPPRVPEPQRNIFAYYEPAPPVKAPSPTPTVTPTPTPPVLITTISPTNVYAQTDEFTLEVSGDKFTPDLKINVDGRELPTRFRNPQQLSAVVPASLIANPGMRQITVRTSDSRLYSKVIQLNISPPPTPNYSYIGLIDTQHRVSTAYLQDKSSKEILNVQRGDLLSGRFRVTSISEKEVVLVDTNLKIRHKLTMSEGERGPGSPLARPTPKVDAEDDEP